MPTPLERYQKKVEELLAQQDKLTDDQIRRVFKLLADTRRGVVADLTGMAKSGEGSFKAWQLGNLRDAIDRQTAELLRQYRPIMGAAVERAWEDGSDLLPRAVKSVGVKLAISREISRDQLVVAQEVAADLVSQVTEEFRTRARSIVSRGVLGEVSPHGVIQEVADLLWKEPGRRATKLGSIQYQAERIMRTEIAGVNSIANVMRQDQVARDVPGMEKYWLATHDGRARPEHLAADARYRPGGTEGPIPVAQDFVVGGEQCRGPHDPRLSAKNRINCRCLGVSYHPDWFKE